MSQVTIMWILTAVNAGVFLLWEIKYRAMYRAYAALFEMLGALIEAETEGMKKVKEIIETATEKAKNE